MQKKWNFMDSNTKIRGELAASLQISEIIAGVLLHRGITDPVVADEFLHSEKQSFENAFLLKGMTIAVKRIQSAIVQQEHITVYGDYDVDGITATALLVRTLKRLGASVDYYIPDRQAEGYGFNTEALKQLCDEGTKLLISVDCGISALEEVATVEGKIDIVITDHHLPGTELPKVLAIINPKQLDCKYPDKNIAGVGVAFKVCQALWKTIKNISFVEDLDIVTLGTVADIVPLLGENRLIVKRGLEELNHSKNIGIKALVQICNLSDKKIDTGHVGFMLAPRLNAAGRLDSALIGVELLLSEDENQVNNIAKQLDDENVKRQVVEKEILAKVEHLLTQIDITQEKVLLLSGENWHTGVIGIVASRIVEKYYKPVLIIGVHDGVGKGSCRSIRGFHMYEALFACKDLLEAFGGHAQAAGLTVKPANIPELRKRLNQLAAERLTEQDYIPVLDIEENLNVRDVNRVFLDELSCLEPYGMGNPRPTFACDNVELFDIRQIGKEGTHLRFKLKQDKVQATALAWNMGEEAERLKQVNTADIAFQPELNEWQGHVSIQLKTQAIRTYEKKSTDLDLFYEENSQLPSNCKESLPVQQFFTKIEGSVCVTCQTAIRGLAIGDVANVIVEQNQVFICTQEKQKIGFLRAEIAQALINPIKQGLLYKAQIMAIHAAQDTMLVVHVLVFQYKLKNYDAAKYKNITMDEVRNVLTWAADGPALISDTLHNLQNNKNTLLIAEHTLQQESIQVYAALQAINQHKLTIVVYPLRSFVNDSYHRLKMQMAKLDLTVYIGTGLLPIHERACLLEALYNQTIDLLLVTPEFLETHLPFLQAGKAIGFFVAAECQYLLQNDGQAFYKNMELFISGLNKPVVLAVTKQLNTAEEEQIKKCLSIETVLCGEHSAGNLQFIDNRNEKFKINYLKSILEKKEQMLIFVNSRQKAWEVARKLRSQYSNLAFYHAGLTALWCDKIEQWFQIGKIQAIITTNSCSDRFTFPNIRHVVQYELPFHKVCFQQHFEKAGRDGEVAAVHVLFGEKDVAVNQLVLAGRAPGRTTVGKVYLILKENKTAQGRVAMTYQQIAVTFNQRYHEMIAEFCVELCLLILEELNLIWRETLPAGDAISFQVQPEMKLDLMQAPSYAEGINEKADFNDFKHEIMNMSENNVLTSINKPLYPDN